MIMFVPFFAGGDLKAAEVVGVGGPVGECDGVVGGLQGSLHPIVVGGVGSWWQLDYLCVVNILPHCLILILLLILGVG